MASKHYNEVERYGHKVLFFTAPHTTH